MNDEEQLRTLSICHYVLAGISALVACLPIIHLVIGIAIVTGNLPDGGKPGPPDAFGWIFVIMGATLILLGWAYAACLAVAGHRLRRKKGYVFCLVAAGLSCMNVPLGTCLGVFTIVVLSRPSVKALFDRARAKAIAPDWDLA